MGFEVCRHGRARLVLWDSHRLHMLYRDHMEGRATTLRDVAGNILFHPFARVVRRKAREEKKGGAAPAVSHPGEMLQRRRWSPK
jgi:hypothetical protein